MSKKFPPGVRCVECGCRLDPGERCDCETNSAARSSTKQIIEHNKAIMKTAYSNSRRINQAYLNFDFK